MRKSGMAVAANPMSEPEWLQVVGIVKNTAVGAMPARGDIPAGITARDYAGGK
jgi:hypothetical protein